MIWVLSICCTSFPPCAYIFLIFFFLANTSQGGQSCKSSECIVCVLVRILLRGFSLLAGTEQGAKLTPSFGFITHWINCCTTPHTSVTQYIPFILFLQPDLMCWQPWLLKKLSCKWFSSGKLGANWLICPLLKCRRYKKNESINVGIFSCYQCCQDRWKFSFSNILFKDPPDRRNGNLKKFLGKLF